MKAGETTLVKLLNTSRQFIVPIYQRSYSWEEKQYRRLWLDVLHAGSFDDGKTHFIGSVVYVDMGTPAGRPQQLMLIDGQQRLMTLSLLLCALRRFVQQHNPPVRLININKLNNQFLYNADEDELDCYKLLPGSKDAATYMSLLDAVEYTVDKPSAGLMSCWQFLCREIANHSDKLDDIFRGVLNLSLVSIALDKDTDNPQRIFESMNSTGRELSPSDLLRNFLLMGLDVPQQNKLYKTYWQPMERAFEKSGIQGSFDAFLRDYLTLQLGKVCKSADIYETFKRFYADRNWDSQAALQNLFIYARYYVYIALNQEPDCDLKRLWRELKCAGGTASYPFFLRLYSDYSRKNLAKSDLMIIIKMTVSYFVRRALCSLSSNSAAALFAVFYDKLNEQNIADSAAKIYMTLRDNQLFPTDYQVRENLIAKDVYHFRLCRYLLESLENFGHKEPIDFERERYSVEHILPQNSELDSTWQQALGKNWRDEQKLCLNLLGNLTLTGYNSEMQDKSFDEKRDMPAGFKHSHLLLNRYLAECSIWNKTEILKRTHLLADDVLRIWPYPGFEHLPD